MKREITNATAIYTGGGTYIYYGQLTDGTYFRACDGWDFIEVCGVDTSVDEAEYHDFYEKHRLETLTCEAYEIFWNDMIQWIVHNEPKGNYSVGELEERLLVKEETYLLKTAYSWGDEESDQEFPTFESAWKEAKELALNECETVSEEHACEIGLSFNKKEGVINLHYTYDNEYCRYSVVKK